MSQSNLGRGHVVSCEISAESSWGRHYRKKKKGHRGFITANQDCTRFLMIYPIWYSLLACKLSMYKGCSVILFLFCCVEKWPIAALWFKQKQTTPCLSASFHGFWWKTFLAWWILVRMFPCLRSLPALHHNHLLASFLWMMYLLLGSLQLEHLAAFLFLLGSVQLLKLLSSQVLCKCSPLM